MKDTFYFSHDYNSRNDEKIKKLICKHGMLGYGIFWAIIEDLYNNANALQTDYDGIAYDLRVDVNIIKSIINDFNLFIISENKFGSKSIEKRLDERNKKSTKARQSAFKRWGKDANALQTECDGIKKECEGNTIKDSIGKENIEKETKEKFTREFSKNLSKYVLNGIYEIERVMLTQEQKNEICEGVEFELNGQIYFNSLKSALNRTPDVVEKMKKQFIKEMKANETFLEGLQNERRHCTNWCLKNVNKKL
jgi:hypothetical protein